MKPVIHIGNMTLELLDNGKLWLSCNDNTGMELTKKNHSELEELLQEFFNKHF